MVESKESKDQRYAQTIHQRQVHGEAIQVQDEYSTKGWVEIRCVERKRHQVRVRVRPGI